ncbi:hypothetical protein PVOR_30058 [Paenibacillus vortex V453]|uniref:Uncharacterized protein n=1 Tax=Paenibacillus vortex V453 TaxID=715225 RepID=A0A2R9SLW3_9BACL|nr:MULTISPECIES: hypothetical protein [Paenibacillus]EFU38340.1 hypothetical protein PVOR_30058 [Paenibacillus vortex V453]MDH6675526.1 hypothetical protein [Paenibacillus sp. LBL]
MVRRKKRAGRFLLGIFILLLVIIGAAVWFVYPTQSLDMRYRSVDFKDKLMTMVSNRDTRMLLSTEEVGELSKKNMVKYISTHNLGVEITGADFTMNGTTMTAHMNGKWGIVPFGAVLRFQMSAEGSHLYLTHQSTTIRGVEVPQNLFQLEPIQVSLKDYLPDLVTVNNVKFLSDGLELNFTMDWMSIPSLFK